MSSPQPDRVTSPVWRRRSALGLLAGLAAAAALVGWSAVASGNFTNISRLRLVESKP